MGKFRVHYPLITRDGSRDFDTKEEAERFAQERSFQAVNGIFGTVHSWRMVRVEELPEAQD